MNATLVVNDRRLFSGFFNLHRTSFVCFIQHTWFCKRKSSLLKQKITGTYSNFSDQKWKTFLEIYMP